MPEDSKRHPANDLSWVVGWVAVLWVVEIVDVVHMHLPGRHVPFDQYGVVPRSERGLYGILLAPFLHAGWGHLIANTIPLLILGWVCCIYGRGLTLLCAVYATIVGGLLTWVIGKPNSVHVGASGVVFGLIGFLLLNGIVRRGVAPLLVALLVLFFFGGSLLANFLPGRVIDGNLMSWEMHLGGFVGGVLASWHLRKAKPQ